MDWIDFEYKIKGLEEGYWRAIGYGDARTIREAANLLHTTLYQLADKIENSKIENSKTED